MGIIRIVFRLIVLVLLTLGCTVVALIGGLIGGHQFSLRTQQFWSKAMLEVFGVKTVLHGKDPQVGLLMANHQSYIDIWIIPKYSISVFVAKIEVKNMPLIGWGATSVDTLYVDRKSKESSRNTKMEIANRLKNNRSITIFPEGTTGDGNGLLPYKLGMFFTSAEAGFPIIPVVIFYENPDLAWVGDDNMGGHFLRNFSKVSTTAHVAFGDPIYNDTGEDLLNEVRNWQLQKLSELREKFG